MASEKRLKNMAIINSPENSHKKAGYKYDWIAIRDEYVTGEMTLDQLAKKHDIKSGAVQQRCRREGWVAARKEFREKVSAKTISKTINKSASERSEILKSVLESTGKSAEIIAGRLDDGEELTSSQIKQYIESLKILEDMARSIQGVLTEQQERKLRIEEERLALEKKKVEAGEPDKNITVHIAGYDDKWSD